MRLKNKVIIVTGATTGIGRAIAERSVAEGARVLVHGINRPEGEELVKQLGPAAALHIDDLVDPGTPARIVAAALKAFGRIDAVVNNAAIVPRTTIATTTVEMFERTMAINVRAPIFLIQAAFAQLKQNQGCVLNIGSINAHSGEPTFLDYSASKGAVINLTKTMAKELAPRNVRVNAIAPGMIETDMSQVVRGIAESIRTYGTQFGERNGCR